MGKRLDIPIGTQFGDWTYLGTEIKHRRQRALHVQCACGTVTYVMLGDLRHGSSTRCRSCMLRRTAQHNAKRRTAQHNTKFKVGDKFGCLTYVSTGLWKCDCGNTRRAYNCDVARGLSYRCKSKACTASDGRAAAYCSWVSMRERCLNPRASNYSLYGGRGIAIDPSFDDFEVFYAHVGPRPRGTTLDRIDVDGNYSPGNLRWATAKTQRANQRRMLNSFRKR